MDGNSSEQMNALLATFDQRLQSLVQALRADQERLGMEQLRAALRTAQAVEEIVQQGVKLQETPTAVWGP